MLMPRMVQVRPHLGSAARSLLLSRKLQQAKLDLSMMAEQSWHNEIHLWLPGVQEWIYPGPEKDALAVQRSLPRQEGEQMAQGQQVTV